MRGNNVNDSSKRRVIKKSAIIGVILCGALFAQEGGGGALFDKKRVKEAPPIAVYVAGNVSDDDKKALGTLVLASLAKSGRYIAVERSDEFLAAVEAEHIKQRSGDVDDSQIRKLGKQFGVKFICVADFTKAFGDFQLSARIIDVETAAVVYTAGEVHGKFKSMGDLARVSDIVLENMFDNEGSSKPRKLHNKVSIAFDIGLDGRYFDNSRFPGYSSPFFYPQLDFDFIYAEISISNIVLLAAKYPIDIGNIKVSPLLGLMSPMGLSLSSNWSDTTYIEYSRDTAYIRTAVNYVSGPALGGRVDVGLSKSAYASAEFLHAFGFDGGNLQSLKISSGLDLGLGKRKLWFWRPGLAYCFTRAFCTTTDYHYQNLETGTLEITRVKENTEILINDLAVYVGIGYKWRGKEQRL